MTNEEYAMTQNGVILLAHHASQLDLATFIGKINTAESVGPLIDPTLYREASENIRKIKALAEALLPFQREAVKQLKK